VFDFGRRWDRSAAPQQELCLYTEPFQQVRTYEATLLTSLTPFSAVGVIPLDFKDRDESPLRHCHARLLSRAPYGARGTNSNRDSRPRRASDPSPVRHAP
jgi:hypothetical protein